MNYDCEDEDFAALKLEKQHIYVDSCPHEDTEENEYKQVICKQCAKILVAIVCEPDVAGAAANQFQKFVGPNAAQLNKTMKDGSIDYGNTAKEILSVFVKNVQDSPYFSELITENFDKEINELLSDVMVNGRTRQAPAKIRNLIIGAICHKVFESMSLKDTVLAKLFGISDPKKITAAIKVLRAVDDKYGIRVYTCEKFAKTYISIFKLEKKYFKFIVAIIEEANLGNRKMRLVMRKPSTVTAGLVYIILLSLKLEYTIADVVAVTGVNQSTVLSVAKEVLAAKKTRYAHIFEKYEIEVMLS